MQTSMFDAYGKLASAGLTATEQTGRFPFQQLAERMIVADVLAKLEPKSGDRLLDIGCGPGNLLIPLSFHVRQAVGIDHPDIIARYSGRFRDSAVQWLGGEFPNVVVDGLFDRVLTYSVLHYLPKQEMVFEFLDAGTRLLAPGGRLLVGDVPNRDRKLRFQNSAFGKAFEIEWRAKVAATNGSKHHAAFDAVFKDIECVVSFGDAEILDLTKRYRSRGFHAYVLPQPSDLPFGHTREDLLIVRP